MPQLSFSDAEYAGKRKQTRREKFLAEMEQVAKPGRRKLNALPPVKATYLVADLRNWDGGS